MFRNFGHVDFDDRTTPIREGQPPRNPQMGTVRQKAFLGKVRDSFARPLTQQNFLSQYTAGMNLREQGIEPFPEGMPTFQRSVREETRRY